VVAAAIHIAFVSIFDSVGAAEADTEQIIHGNSNFVIRLDTFWSIAQGSSDAVSVAQAPAPISAPNANCLAQNSATIDVRFLCILLAVAANLGGGLCSAE
jgi:hypothetical protein